ncbi:elongation factor Ts, mitochondrial-like [Glandiceps talaboti]
MLACRNYHITSFCNRFLHTGGVLENVASKARKSNLAKLRKKTGFSFANCRKALDKFENDLGKAEEWLKNQAQKEGWAKATKLQHREMAQGLIGVLCEKNSATMVEVNCETDFVAKNTKFQHLVGQVANVTLNHFKSLHENSTNHIKVNITGEELNQIQTDEQKTLKELLVLTIGRLGENAAIRRAVFLSTPADSLIGSYTHSTLQANKDVKHKCVFGKYGAIVTYKKTSDVGKTFNANEFGRRLGQHIVGMSPTSIGNLDDVKERKPEVKDVVETSSEDSTDEPAESTTESWTIDESEMVKQEFLLDPSITVGELLKEEGVEVMDFVRYQCGEEIQ